MDRRRNPAIASYLREALAAGTQPEDLYKPTLTHEEKKGDVLGFYHSHPGASTSLSEKNPELLVHIEGSMH